MKSSIALVVLLLAAGCTTDDTIRTNGVTFGAGDAIAANTVMQMVDPWPHGVQDTDLVVPVERPEAAAIGSAAQGSAATQDF
jgi:hypothetical protein